jgi:hypothetical protein
MQSPAHLHLPALYSSFDTPPPRVFLIPFQPSMHPFHLVARFPRYHFAVALVLVYMLTLGFRDQPGQHTACRQNEEIE